MKILHFLLLLVLIPDLVVAQIQYENAILMEKSDPIYPVIKARQMEIEKKYEAGDYAVAQFTPWIRVDSPAVAKLFPHLRFASVMWSEGASPKSKTHQVGRALGLELTVGVDVKSLQATCELLDYGNQEAYAQMLKDAKVRIVTREDAKTVWEAFCALTRHHWEANPAIKVSDTVWRLGKSTDASSIYYYEVLLDADHVVKSGTLKSDRSK